MDMIILTVVFLFSLGLGYLFTKFKSMVIPALILFLVGIGFFLLAQFFEKNCIPIIKWGVLIISFAVGIVISYVKYYRNE